MPALTLAPPIVLPRDPGALRTPSVATADPRTRYPLHGLTLLAVEDSRFAADALRLICQRSGARLRRAETVHAARSHLAVYRADVVMVDLGLPDGRGEDLIAAIARSDARPALLLAMSGDVQARGAALAAGADVFVEKPLPGLVAFQRLILHHLGGAQPAIPDAAPVPEADPVALHDDLVRAAGILGKATDPEATDYVAGFVAGVARHAGDRELADAADRARGDAGALTLLRGMIADRLGEAQALPAGFDRRSGPG